VGENGDERAGDAEVERAQLETFLHHIPVGVVVVDAATRAIVRMNREAERLLQVAAGAAVDVQAYRAFDHHGREYERHEWPVWRTLESGETIRGEIVRVQFADETSKTVSITSAPVETRGRRTGVVVVLEDITDQVRRARAERDFVTNAAHELQTPIASISSAIDVLQAGAKEYPAERDRFLAHIETATERLGRLTRALLVLARAQTREEVPRRDVIELSPLLNGVANSVPGAIDVDCPPRLAVIANRELLEQALVNLSENARKYSAETVSLRARRAGRRIRIEVHDNGLGIPESERELVFRRFFRSTAADRDGFGLGLAIVRESVAALDGELELETGPEGTLVSIVLPGATLRAR